MPDQNHDELSETFNDGDKAEAAEQRDLVADDHDKVLIKIHDLLHKDQVDQAHEVIHAALGCDNDNPPADLPPLKTTASEEDSRAFDKDFVDLVKRHGIRAAYVFLRPHDEDPKQFSILCGGEQIATKWLDRALMRAEQAGKLMALITGGRNPVVEPVVGDRVYFKHPSDGPEENLLTWTEVVNVYAATPAKSAEVEVQLVKVEKDQDGAMKVKPAVQAYRLNWKKWQQYCKGKAVVSAEEVMLAEGPQQAAEINEQAATGGIQVFGEEALKLADQVTAMHADDPRRRKGKSEIGKLILE